MSPLDKQRDDERDAWLAQALRYAPDADADAPPALSDTIGVGTPRQPRDIVQRALDELPISRVALHLHDTRGTALANALVGLEMGVRDFDASVGGVGGCPYAPGAAGNLAEVQMTGQRDVLLGVETLLADGTRTVTTISAAPPPGTASAAAP